MDLRDCDEIHDIVYKVVCLQIAATRWRAATREVRCRREETESKGACLAYAKPRTNRRYKAD